jgi:hypothetical protein
MSNLVTFNTSKKRHLRLIIFITSPDFETSDLFMAVQSTSVTLNYVCFMAVDGKMANLVAFEANFLGARKGVVSVFSTQNACSSLGFIWALSGPMTAFSTILAANKRVFS